MRLERVAISGFRAFGGQIEFDLDADVVLLSGPNGSGKTSLYDAVLWALTGAIGRFAKDERQVTSHYSSSGEAHVSLSLRSADRAMLISRTLGTRSSKDRLTVDVGDRHFEGTHAQAALLDELWPSALASEDQNATFATALTRSVYLQQDLVRQFLVEDSDEARFKILSELVGAGRLTDLIRELEGSRNRWSRTGTKESEELGGAARRAQQVRDRLIRLTASEGAAPDFTSAWESWWKQVREMGLAEVVPGLDTLEAASLLDRTIRELQIRRRALERQLASGRALLAEMENAPSFGKRDGAKLDAATLRTTELEQELIAARADLAKAEAAAAAERRRLTELRESGEELRSLARLAVKHLGEKCPVCDQPYDKKAVEQRLRRLTQSTVKKTSATSAPEDVGAALTRIEEIEVEIAQMNAENSELERRRAQAEEWALRLEARLKEIDVAVPPEGLRDAVRRRIDALERSIEQAGQVQVAGEQVALTAARAAEQAQRRELEAQLGRAESEVARLEAAVTAHSRTYDMATEILNGCRTAAWDAVGERIGQIGPIAERIYARMDSHPSLTRVRLDTITLGQKGKVSVRVGDRHEELIALSPLPMLSSSQLNVLAVSLFLAFNIGVHDVPLDCALLDDPLQTLDDVNLLGLVDTFRRLKAKRQLVVSTHDVRFAALLARKLRPVGSEGRTVHYSFGEWTLDGPPVSFVEIRPSSGAILVAA